MKNVFLSVIALSMSMMMMALPARRLPREVEQADGSKMTVYAHGDEHFHWFTNEKGEWVRADDSGMWRVVEPLTDSEITKRRQAARRYSSRRRVVGERNVAPRGLVILVNFVDKSFTTSKAEMDSMLIGYNYTRNYSYTYYGEKFTCSSAGSARQYFYDVSDGQYNPQFEVVGPVTVSRNMKYYGQNVGEEDARAEVMIQEACKLADSQYNVDFSKYDNDGDGYVDFVYVIYAGYGEADGGGDNTIWPHSWNLTEGNINLELDGKTLDLYACGSELSYISKKHDGIGTFCHEFSHVLGLPDFYATVSNADWKTCGEWDIMDYGPYNNDGNTPPAYSGYERWFMGWLTPRVINEQEAVSLTDINKGGEVLLISTTGKHNLDGVTPNPATYYLIDNRQQTGWNKYIPGHGMMLTKVAYNATRWEENTVNNTRGNLCYDIIEADGKTPTYDEDNRDNGYFGKPGDLFPSGAKAYTKISGYPIRNIKETNGVITFDFMNNSEGGGSEGGQTAGGCDTYDYMFASKTGYGQVQLGNYTWTISAENETYIGYTTDKGEQFGSSKQPAVNVELTTADAADCLVSSITVEAAMGSRGNAKLAVLINGITLGQSQSLTTTLTKYTYYNTADLKGNITINLYNTQKAMYISAINIDYKADATTSVEQVKTSDTAPVKRIENGKLIININGTDYDITGRQIR